MFKFPLIPLPIIEAILRDRSISYDRGYLFPLIPLPIIEAILTKACKIISKHIMFPLIPLPIIEAIYDKERIAEIAEFMVSINSTSNNRSD